VRTATKAEIDAVVEGSTTATCFVETVRENGSRIALRWLDDSGEWQSLDYDGLADKVARAAAALAALGVGPGDRVVLMMRNIPEFHWLDLAALFLRATPVSIYNSSSAEQVAFLAGHCEAKMAIVEDERFLSRFAEVRGELPSLSEIIVLSPPEDLPEGALTASVLDADPLDLVSAAAKTEAGDLATIIYTSGTTGNPKGVMLSNYNICWTMESLVRSFEWSRDDMAGKKVVSYLPMAHIAERMVSHYSMVMNALEVSTCPETSQLTTYLGAVRPNIIFGVPRVWEKLHAGITAAIGADPEKAQKFAEAIDAAGPIREKMTWDLATDEEIATYQFLDDVAFSTVRQLVGLDECEMAVSGAAPIPASLLQWFRTIGLPLAEIYGMSENSGPMSFDRTKVKPGWVGRAMPGSELRIFPDGEVCCRGGHVFQGYVNAPDKTAEAIDEDGWLHSGDIGEIDDDGYLRIVDRKKELIITAGGKNISPANLEAALKTVPLIGQAAVIGDNRPFVSALVVVDSEVAPVWAAQHGIEFTDIDEFARNPAVVEAIDAGVAEAMEPFNKAERVKKVKILTEEWMPDSELLTPTSKLKRRGILSRYSKEIEGIYA
jgi:long-chain acyl-CoA synthetase